MGLNRTGITLAALNVGLIAWLRADVAEVKRGQSLLEEHLLAVEKEQDRTTGLLKGLGLTGRAGVMPQVVERSYEASVEVWSGNLSR